MRDAAAETGAGNTADVFERDLPSQIPPTSAS